LRGIRKILKRKQRSKEKKESKVFFKKKKKREIDLRSSGLSMISQVTQH
jgi:hypothetical protein